MRKLLLSALAVSALLVSCSKDDAKVVDTPPTKQEIPEGTFGQIKYIQDNMHKESPKKLLEVFDKFKENVAKGSNQEEVWNDFKGWIENVTPKGKASNGVAGEYGKKPRYINDRGIENEQLIKKGLIGAYQLNSAMNIYGSSRGKSGDELKKVLEDFATVLIGSYENIDNEKIAINDHGVKNGYKVSEGNEFAKYLNVVSEYSQFSTLSDDLYKELKEAKKNLNDYSKFERNLAKALEIAQKVTAVRGVQYLKESASKLGDNTKFEDALHGASEGLGFVYSLQFATYNPVKHQLRDEPIRRGLLTEFIRDTNLWLDASVTQQMFKDFGKKIAKNFGFDYDTVDAK